MLRESDINQCRALLREGSRTFHAASFLLPKEVRDRATALYAFCRVADDAVDHGGGHAALDALRERLDRVYAGHPHAHPIDRAFAVVIAECAIPRVVPDALLEGLAWDVEGRTYTELSDVLAYAVRVAGTVGVMMALAMGVRARESVARAIDLGVAMQLSNIARDVGEDARAGRIYLPRRWLDELDIDSGTFADAATCAAGVTQVVRRLLVVGDELYQRGSSGIDGLPWTCRPGIRAARALYAEIGREVERRGDTAMSTRAVVTSRRKLRVLIGANVPGRGRRSADWSAPAVLAEAAFLVAAVDAAEAPPRSQRAPSVENTIALFEKLGQRDRATRPAFAAAFDGRSQRCPT